ncbi:hypothetical protein SAMN05444280_12328 [Tangfeifania diversioriginum]|uniref:Transcriptional regulator, AbiEi antitoxin, Type IV TA system n=1 Tax=Tangfeifania diversioriginum TaxID=1168035 RepID=A0A1M6KFQ6_9BACT|nr:hypothetical protein [Tangfeifania diversioriginum]SHJ57710.1 hypothetical protein SAMN05444280_12328 [Tangfeifania diversioriginum]
MFSSQIIKGEILFIIYQSNKSVFRLNEIAMLSGETNFISLNQKLNYYIRTGKLENPRKGIYAKPGFNPEELACSVYTPSYISLEYVLQRSGVIFQYTSFITSVSYLSREIEINGQIYRFRKIKDNVLVNTSGIVQKPDFVNMATPERAFLDLLYLDPGFFFDNLNPLDKEKIDKLLSGYQSKALTERVTKIFKNG